MTEGVEYPVSMPSKLSSLAAEENTSWYLLHILDAKLDWRQALEKARLHIDGDSSSLCAPNAEGLGLQVDEEATPSQMMVLRPTDEGLLPAGRISAYVKMGSLLPQNESADGAGYKITPVPTPSSYTAGGSPLAFWRLCHSMPEDDILKTLSFKARSKKLGDSKHWLHGSFEVAPKLRLLGLPLKQKATRYLIGGVAAGSKKMLVYEADVYAVERDGEFGRDKAEEEKLEAEERKVLDFRTQRSEAIKLSANVTKQRQEASKEMRMVDETKVADMEDCVTEMNKRAMSAKDMDEIKENDAVACRQRILPRHDTAAAQPGLIFSEGLELMLPSQLLATDGLFHDDRMTGLLQRPSRISNIGMDELKTIFKGAFAATVVSERASSSSGDASSSYDEAEATAKRFGVLNLLIKLYCTRKQRLKLAEFQSLMGVSNASEIASHLFEYFSEVGQTGSKLVRKILKEKIICHLIVLALDLSVSFKLDFQSLRDELGVDVREMMDRLRYVGCEVNKSTTDNNRVKLDTVLKAPLMFQSLNKGAGRGKRKRT